MTKKQLTPITASTIGKFAKLLEQRGVDERMFAGACIDGVNRLVMHIRDEVFVSQGGKATRELLLSNDPFEIREGMTRVYECWGFHDVEIPCPRVGESERIQSMREIIERQRSAGRFPIYVHPSIASAELVRGGMKQYFPSVSDFSKRQDWDPYLTNDKGDNAGWFFIDALPHPLHPGVDWEGAERVREENRGVPLTMNAYAVFAEMSRLIHGSYPDSQLLENGKVPNGWMQKTSWTFISGTLNQPHDCSAQRCIACFLAGQLYVFDFYEEERPDRRRWAVKGIKKCVGVRVLVPESAAT